MATLSLCLLCGCYAHALDIIRVIGDQVSYDSILEINFLLINSIANIAEHYTKKKCMRQMPLSFHESEYFVKERNNKFIKNYLLLVNFFSLEKY